MICEGLKSHDCRSDRPLIERVDPFSLLAQARFGRGDTINADPGEGPSWHEHR